MNSIGIIHSPYKEKFSIPRQPGLTSLESIIELTTPYNRLEALMGLENFSHLWVIFLFHETEATSETSLTVRPPRLGGNTKQGVFATRSPYRPNNIGLSLVKIKNIDGVKITILGGDFLNGTPILDLKPYLPTIESIPSASGSWTDSLEAKKLEVIFEKECEEFLTDELKQGIKEILSLDPRPQFHEDEYKTYGSKLFDFDVHWIVKNNQVHVTEIIEIIEIKTI